jgi:hypothetical protein
MNAPVYDEDSVFRKYVYRYYGSLMTELERKADMAFLVQSKAEALDPSDPYRSKVEAHFSHANEREVSALLSSGFESFERSVVARIIRQHGAALFVNRCPHCQRIVQTPRARQCLWCGLSWHRAARASHDVE